MIDLFLNMFVNLLFSLTSDAIILVFGSLVSLLIITSSNPWSEKETSVPSTLVPETVLITISTSSVPVGVNTSIKGVIVSNMIFLVEWTCSPPTNASLLNDNCGWDIPEMSTDLPSRSILIKKLSMFLSSACTSCVLLILFNATPDISYFCMVEPWAWLIAWVLSIPLTIPLKVFIPTEV